MTTLGVCYFCEAEECQAKNRKRFVTLANYKQLGMIMILFMILSLLTMAIHFLCKGREVLNLTSMLAVKNC